MHFTQFTRNYAIYAITQFTHLRVITQLRHFTSFYSFTRNYAVYAITQLRSLRILLIYA